MAPHSSALAWRIPWTEEPGGLQSMGSQSRTRLSDFTFALHFHALEKEMATHSSAGKWKEKVKSLSRVWLCDPMDCSPPGSSVHGILQARTLEWADISLSRWKWRWSHNFSYEIIVGFLFPNFPSKTSKYIIKKKRIQNLLKLKWKVNWWEGACFLFGFATWSTYYQYCAT